MLSGIMELRIVIILDSEYNLWWLYSNNRIYIRILNESILFCGLGL